MANVLGLFRRKGKKTACRAARVEQRTAAELAYPWGKPRSGGGRKCGKMRPLPEYLHVLEERR